MQWDPKPPPHHTPPNAPPCLNHRRLANTNCTAGAPKVPPLCWPPGLFRVDALLELYSFRRLRGTEARLSRRQFGVGVAVLNGHEVFTAAGPHKLRPTSSVWFKKREKNCMFVAKEKLQNSVSGASNHELGN